MLLCAARLTLGGANVDISAGCRAGVGVGSGATTWSAADRRSRRSRCSIWSKTRRVGGAVRRDRLPKMFASLVRIMTFSLQRLGLVACGLSDSRAAIVACHASHL